MHIHTYITYPAINHLDPIGCMPNHSILPRYSGADPTRSLCRPKRKVQRTWMTSWRAFTVFTKARVRPAKSMGSVIFIANESSFLDPLYRVGCKRIEKEWELFPYIFINWNPVKGSIFRPSHALHWQTLGGLIRLLNWGHGSKLPTSKSCSGGLHWRQRSLQIRTPRFLVLSYCLD